MQFREFKGLRAGIPPGAAQPQQTKMGHGIPVLDKLRAQQAMRRSQSHRRRCFFSGMVLYFTAAGAFQGQHIGRVGHHLGIADGGEDVVLVDRSQQRAATQRRDRGEFHEFIIVWQQGKGQVVKLGKSLGSDAGGLDKAVVFVLSKKPVGVQLRYPAAIDFQQQGLQVGQA